MSIVSALSDYLMTFEGVELRGVEMIYTDRPEEQPSSMAVAPTGSGRISKDITGKRYYQNSYVIMARERTGAEYDRADNWDFFEAFMDWLEEQDAAQNYPILPGSYVVDELTVSNAMLFDLDEGGLGTYQIQIQLSFYKE